MTFIPRTFEEIRDDMLAYLRFQTNVTDEEIGSVIRTVIEGAALEDDEQYFQMVQLLDSFKFSTAVGQDLISRISDFNIIPLDPAAATGYVVIINTNLDTTTFAYNANAGATSVQVDDSSLLATSGFPYIARLGEGTTSEEDVSVLANDTGTNTLTTSALLYDHNIGERVSQVPTGSDTTLQPGIRVQVPAAGTTSAINFVTVESGTLVNGNYYSTQIQIKAESPGSNGNVGTGQISQFAASPPFDGASVTNLKNTAGGRDLESDPEIRDRVRAILQSLSKGTVLSLKQGVLGVEDPVTGQRVTTSCVFESFADNEVTVYVDDGTGFTPDMIELPRTTLHTGCSSGASTLIVESVTGMSDEGAIVLDTSHTAIGEVLRYTSINRTTKTLTLEGTTANAHLAGVEVAVVDYIEDNAESGAKFFNLATYPIVQGSLRLWVQPVAGSIYLKTENTDYLLNRGNGQLEFVDGVATSAKIYASYSYYTALLYEVQKVINGLSTDYVNYPGLRAGGVRVYAATPVIRRVNVRLSVTAKPGVDEASIRPLVQEAIEAYINSLSIGEDVIRAEIIKRAMSVSGVADIVVSLPTTNVIVLENELPKSVDANGDSLVTVG